MYATCRGPRWPPRRSPVAWPKCPSGWLYKFYRSLEGSFSAGSTATIATKYSFFQVFRDLQNYLAKFSKILQNFAKNQRFSQKSALFLQKSGNFKFRKKSCKIYDFLQNFATFSKNQLDSFVDLEKPEKMRIWLLS